MVRWRATVGAIGALVFALAGAACAGDDDKASDASVFPDSSADVLPDRGADVARDVSAADGAMAVDGPGEATVADTFPFDTSAASDGRAIDALISDQAVEAPAFDAFDAPAADGPQGPSEASMPADAPPPADASTTVDSALARDSAELDATPDADAPLPGTAGDAGDSAPDAPRARVAAQCVYACESDDDCKIGGQSAGVCDAVTHLCGGPVTHCESHDDCFASASLWRVVCVGDGGCAATSACVMTNGEGRCAPRPRAHDSGTGCTGLTPNLITMPRFSDGGAVDVCGKTSSRCRSGACAPGCVDNTSCGRGVGSVCNTESGECECLSDGECTVAGVSACNPTTHLCGCARDADCTAVGTNVCVEGNCGCSGKDRCPDAYDNAPPACQ